jgi:hypothetical protein
MRTDAETEKGKLSTAYESGSVDAYEAPPPELPKTTFSEVPNVPFTAASNLDTATLDPEMSTYFLGHHLTQDQASYSETEAEDFLHQPMVSDNNEDQPWSSQFMDHSYDSYIAQPFPSTSIIDPKLLGPHVSLPHDLHIGLSGNVSPPQTDQLSFGIAPIMLSQTPPLEIQDETKQPSNALEQRPNEVNHDNQGLGEFTTEIYVKQKGRPPKRLEGKSTLLSPAIKEGESKTNGLSTAKRQGRPLKSTIVQPSLSAHPTLSSPLSHHRTRQPMPESTREHPPEHPSKPSHFPTESVEGVTKRRYEVSVPTGLDSVKRIKLIFHEDLPSPQTSLPAPPASAANPIDGDSHRRSFPLSRKRDILPRPNVSRDTPPAALVDDVTQKLPMARELHLDNNTPPAMEVIKKNVVGGVVIPRKKIDRKVYQVFLSNRARQTMVRKRDGKVKGIKFQWGDSD